MQNTDQEDVFDDYVWRGCAVTSRHRISLITFGRGLDSVPIWEILSVRCVGWFGSCKSSQKITYSTFQSALLRMRFGVGRG